MGMICSAIQGIDAARFTALTRGKVHKAESIMLLDRGGDATKKTTALVKLDDGQFSVIGAHHTPNGKWAVSGYGSDLQDQAVLRAMVRMGAISEADMAAHVASEMARRARQERKFNIQHLERLCADLGIPVPAVPE